MFHYICGCGFDGMYYCNCNYINSKLRPHKYTHLNGKTIEYDMMIIVRNEGDVDSDIYRIELYILIQSSRMVSLDMTTL